jgi:hypothetical protein
MSSLVPLSRLVHGQLFLSIWPRVRCLDELLQLFVEGWAVHLCGRYPSQFSCFLMSARIFEAIDDPHGGRLGEGPLWIGRCDLAENLAAQAMTDLTERGSLDVRELQPPFQLDLGDWARGPLWIGRATRPTSPGRKTKSCRRGTNIWPLKTAS